MIVLLRYLLDRPIEKSVKAIEPYSGRLLDRPFDDAANYFVARYWGKLPKGIEQLPPFMRQIEQPFVIPLCAEIALNEGVRGHRIL